LVDDAVARLVAAVVIGIVVLALARAARKFEQPVHPFIDLAATDLPTGVVLFTSTDCTNCAAARERLKQAGVSYREVTWELEGRVLERAGVQAVPVAVFRGEDGATVAQIAGVPTRRALRKAIAAL
jgi:glutaredoxin